MSDRQEQWLDDVCVICRRSAASATNLSEKSWFINIVTDFSRCRHKFCEPCKDREFDRNHQFACSACREIGVHTIVSKQTLKENTLDEIEVNRDTKIRKKLKLIFNKDEESFPDMDSYRDFDEMVETYIYNLTHGIDVAETNAKVEEYEKMNSSAILANQVLHEEKVKSIELKIEKEKDLAASLQRQREDEAFMLRNYKKELKRQNNEMTLGERDSITVINPFGPSKLMQGHMNPSISSMNINSRLSLPTDAPAPTAFQRLFATLPRLNYTVPLPVEAEKSIPIQSPQWRRLATACGYQESLKERRNLSELFCGLAELKIMSR